MQGAIKEATSTPMGLPMTLTPDEKQFIIDTSASITIRHSSEDLISPISSVQHTELKGITLGLTVQGMGTVAYTFWANDGTIFSLTLPNTLYVPNLPIWLICPRHVAEVTQCEGDGFNSTHPTGIFTCCGHKITIPYHHSTGLTLLQSAPGITTYHNFLTQIHDTSKQTAAVTHIKKTPSQCIKLILHERCNHMNFQQLNQWIRHGHFPVDAAIANSPDPLCSTCQYGKAKRKSHNTDKGSITASHTFPGAGISTDQMEAGYPGRMMTTKGLPSPLRYKNCNFWVDHHSRYIFPTFHVTKDALEMLKSKQLFKDFSRWYNVSIRSI